MSNVRFYTDHNHYIERPGLVAKIIGGSDNRVYERIERDRHTENKQIITWLRNIDGRSIYANYSDRPGSLTQLSVATSLLNLSVTAVGFVMIMRQLQVIEQKLASIASLLAGVNRKLDLSFYATFEPLWSWPCTAFEMREESNRRITATQAINRFLEAKHHYLGLLDMEFDAGSWAVAQFIDT